MATKRFWLASFGLVAMACGARTPIESGLEGSGGTGIGGVSGTGALAGTGGQGAFGGVGAFGGTGAIGGVGAFGGGGVGAFGGGGVGAFGGGGVGAGGSGGFAASGGVGGGPADCCVPTPGPGCLNPALQNCVCAKDIYCCQTAWDSVCVNEVFSLGCGDCNVGGSGGVAGFGGTAGFGGVAGFGGTAGFGGVAGFGGTAGFGGVAGFGGSGGSTGFCGDGVLGPGEQCDLGPANADRPAFELEYSGIKQSVRPFEQQESAATFYSYSSASSHTGLEAVGASRMLLQRDDATGVLSLVMFHGIDQNSSGQSQPAAKVQFSLVGLPDATIVAVADDNLNEFNKLNATSGFGNWSFQNNSDGGVLSGFPVPGNWEVTVSATFSAAIKDWSFVDSNKSFIFVAPGGSASLILRAYDSPAKCRLDCTIPSCGDGVLDGGEVCDDGNNVSGDGCSADCKSLM